MAGTGNEPTPALLARFEDLLDHAPRAERGEAFGYPCSFVGTEMFMGVHGDRLVLRLSEPDRRRMATLGAEPFEPAPGQLLEEYVLVPSRLIDDDAAMSAWISRAYAFALYRPTTGDGPTPGAGAGST